MLKRGVVIPLCYKSFWPEVDIGVSVGAPLGKRPVGRQCKNRFKSCIEGGSGKKASDKDKEKTKKMVCGPFVPKLWRVVP
jgi:hypothetical protein